VFEDGANGGKQAAVGLNSVRHSKQIDDGSERLLPRFGLIAHDVAEEEIDVENQSFQTVLVEVEETTESQLGETPAHLTSLYGPERPQYAEIVSIIEGETDSALLFDEATLSRMEHFERRAAEHGL